MEWTAQIFQYCERGLDPGFWAEPLNALSNAAFLIASIVSGTGLRRTAGRSICPEASLICLAGLIGAGSFLFHTFATRWAMAADVGAIFVFTFAYLGYAQRRFVGLGWWGTLIGLAVMAAMFAAAPAIPCNDAWLPATDAAGGRCLNGSLGYVPVLVALSGASGWLLKYAHPAGGYLLAAAGLFALSLGFRAVDIEVCQITQLLGQSRGTHAIWHVLNATAIYLLLRAATRFGAPESATAARGRLIAPPAFSGHKKPRSRQ